PAQGQDAVRLGLPHAHARSLAGRLRAATDPRGRAPARSEGQRRAPARAGHGVSSEAGLGYRERPAAGVPEGLLGLHHGRGTDESALLGLGDALDPSARLALVTPRAALRLSGAPGYHWYLVSRVGYPDPDTFDASYRQLAAFHDELWRRTGL